MGYNVDEERFEPTIDTDKRDYDTEAVSAFEDVSDVLEVAADNFVGDGTVNDVAEDIVVEADSVILDVNTTDEGNVEVAELTVDEMAEQIAATIQKYYKSYDYLSAENKARLFNFRIDDNSYNLELHAGVLKKLGIQMYGSDRFEDYQSIYEEMMKKAEKRDSSYEFRYDDKKWERGR